MSDKVIKAIDEEVATLLRLRAMLTSSPAIPGISLSPEAAAPVVKKKRVLSEETKRLMAISQAKRWAELKKKKKQDEKATKGNTSPAKKAAAPTS